MFAEAAERENMKILLFRFFFLLDAEIRVLQCLESVDHCINYGHPGSVEIYVGDGWSFGEFLGSHGMRVAINRTICDLVKAPL